ncbi:unnamed protein product, partial [Hymenolepis diminuta]
VLSKVENIFKIGFSKDPSLIIAANKACECFVSQNAITSTLGGSRKTAEFLARYADLLLRKDFTPKIARNTEEGISHMMKVYRFANDKDIFQKFYGNFLARRLVKNQSVSEESERSVINSLEKTCGLTCLRRYNQMLKDLNSARELNGKYHEWLDERFQKKPIPDFVSTSITILNSLIWPIQPRSALRIPFELETSVNTMKEFYTMQCEKLQQG